MTATVSSAGSVGHREPILTACRRLRRGGLSDSEAVNVVALVNGLATVSRPWKVREPAHLLFLRDLSATRDVWTGAEDRASTDVDAGWRIRRFVPRHLDQADGRITLLTLFQAVAGPAATLDRLAPTSSLLGGASAEAGREGG